MQFNHKGHTLVELIVVMAVFMAVLIISGEAFKTILDQSTKVFRSEESNIEGMVGLEMFRHDIQQAGLGLFSETSPVTYVGEAANTPASLYNDYDSGTEPPRPIVAGNNLGTGLSDLIGSDRYNFISGSDYLAIKSTSVGRSKAAQKWTYLEFAASGVTPHSWVSASENLATGDSTVLLRRMVSASTQSATLVPEPSGSFYYSFSNSAFTSYSSTSSALYTAYGIGTGNLRMPFNRTDYFISLPADSAGDPDPSRVPEVCAKDASGKPNPAVGVLYKTTVNHNNGRLTYIPLLDCVADLQVVLGWDMDGNGAIDSYTNADGSTCSGLCPASQHVPALANQVQDALSKENNSSSATIPNIRNNLKMVKVYILAQNGRGDPGYVSPSPIIVGDAGETALTRSYDLASKNLLNYRWKLYRIVVRPKNLPSNQ
jgi:hypothetical protein